MGLSYNAPEKVTYRARLDGLDDSWRELGSQRVAAYEAVPPGRYTFEVVAVNGDGVWSKQPARIAIRVRPHFWESAWFILTMTALTLAGTAGIGIAARDIIDPGYTLRSFCTALIGQERRALKIKGLGFWCAIVLNQRLQCRS